MNVLNKIKSKKNPQPENHPSGPVTTNIIEPTPQPQSKQTIKLEVSKEKNIEKSMENDKKKQSYKPSKQKTQESKHGSKRDRNNQKQQKETFPDIFSNRDSDFSEQSFPRIDSLSRVLKIQRQMNTQVSNNQAKQNISKRPQTTNDQHQLNKISKQEPPVQYSELLFVKKGYQIGRMSVFEGVLEHKRLEKGLNVKIRVKETQIKIFSCKAELIPNPESISQIYLNKIVEIGDKEYLIGDPHILKVVQKSNSQNKRFAPKYN